MAILKALKALFGKPDGMTPVVGPVPGASGLTLTFQCVVQGGEGRFSRLVFPGKNDVANAPADWPELVQPGSLNCRVVEFPHEFDAVAGAGDRIQKLDKAGGTFPPVFAIPREDIQNNSVAPRHPGHDPRMGIAQAWRCAVRNEDTGEEFTAWHVRRVDGTYPKFHGVIELVADRKLRDAHALHDDTRLTITMFSPS